MFAIRHPEEVARIVLLDARHQYMDAVTSPAEMRAFVDAVEAQGRDFTQARKIGVARIFGSSMAGAPPIPAETRRVMVLQSAQPSAIAATNGEAQARAASDVELQSAPSLGDRPLIVLVAGQTISMTPHWDEAQRQQATLSSDSRLVELAGGSHFIQWNEPQLVIDAVREVIAKVRSR
jgi:pimeloyl-ACP methyl ester carboxylesterase